MITFEIKRRIGDSYYPLLLLTLTLLIVKILRSNYLKYDINLFEFYFGIIPSSFLLVIVSVYDIENGALFNIVYIYGFTKIKILLSKIISFLIFPLTPLAVIALIFDLMAGFTLSHTATNIASLIVQILIISTISLIVGIISKNTVPGSLVSLFLIISSVIFSLENNRVILDILYPFDGNLNYQSIILLFITLVLAFISIKIIEPPRET